LWKQSEPKSDTSKDAKSKLKHEEWDKMLGTALTASEVLATDWGQLEWIVDGLIPEGLTVFSGQSKIGKSWFLLQLAICAAMNRRFLKSFDTSKYEVLYIALEDNERRMKSRLQRLKLKVNDGLKIIHTWTDQWHALDYFLEKNPLVKVVIIDTWGRFVTGVCKDGNDYAETTELAANLHKLARKHKAAIIAVTHTKKGTSTGDWIDDTIGSKALVAVADTIIKLSRDRNETEGTLCLTGRDVEEKVLLLNVMTTGCGVCRTRKD
jgi:RecA-family ATPase